MTAKISAEEKVIIEYVENKKKRYAQIARMLRNKKKAVSIRLLESDIERSVSQGMHL